MASARLNLTWSVPVAPDVLHAHLHAYEELQKTQITALRLCHRFGRGDKVFITKLPKELLDSIEDVLREDHCRRNLEVKRQSFKCFREVCRPHEHLASPDRSEMYLKEFGSFTCGSCGLEICKSPCEEFEGEGCLFNAGVKGREDDMPNDSGEVTHHNVRDADLATLNARLLKRYQRDRGNNPPWVVKHYNEVDCWVASASTYCGSEPSQADPRQKSLFRDFGLHTWWTHSRQHGGQQDWARGLNTLDAGHSTQAFLTLPNRGFGTNLERIDVGDSHVDAEALNDDGHAIEVAMPQAPTEEEIQRFARAWRMLRLEQPEDEGTASQGMMYASRQDERWEEKEKGETAGKEMEPWMPKLRLLMSWRLDEYL